MIRSLQDLEKIPVHFILCTERTGSSLLSLMFNLNPTVLSPSEEPFAIYFYKRYGNKTKWTEQEIKKYVDDFWLMAEKDLGLFFTTKESLYNALIPFKEELSYKNLVKLTYLQFIEPKPKQEIKCILDKQIKYFFYLPLLCEIFPDARFVVLVRDVRDNIISKINHKLNSSVNAVFLSSLWHFTYKNTDYLFQKNKPVLLVKYEDMVMDTQRSVKEMCAFLGVTYDENMLNTEGKYQAFLELRKDFVDPKFIEYLSVFQKSLFSGVAPNKIGVHKKQLDPGTEAKINKQNQSLFQRFNYPCTTENKIHFSLRDRWQIFLAFLYRPLLLKVYLQIPLSIKLVIKTIRKRK